MNISYNFIQFRNKCYDILYVNNQYQYLIEEIKLLNFDINTYNDNNIVLLYDNINHIHYKNIIHYLILNENFDNDFKTEYYQIRKTIVLFAYYGYKFINHYYYHISQINKYYNNCDYHNQYNITDLHIYINSLYYYIENEKKNGFLFSKEYNNYNYITILDLVIYYLSKYSDILYDNNNNNLSDNNSEDSCLRYDNNDSCDNRMKFIIDEINILNDLFESFGCDLNINNYFNNVYKYYNTN